MAFKKVLDLNADITVSLGGSNKKTGKKNPTEVEGFYLGSRKVDDKKKKSGYSYIHTLQTDKGNLGVWGKTDLDRKLITVTPGTMVRITHTGMVPTPNGDMYKFSVEHDEDNIIDVGALSVNNDDGAFTSGGADDEDEAYVASSLNDGSGDANDDADYQQDAALHAAERKAKVEALLKKNKSVKN